MNEKIEVDVANIGGGLVGCSAVLALRGMGLQVALLDKGFCGAQASGVNFGACAGKAARQLSSHCANGPMRYGSGSRR